MALQKVLFGAAIVAFPGVNNASLQQSPVVGDVYDSMAAADTAALPAFEAAGDSHMPPRSVQVFLQTGGDITSAAAATRAMSNGDTAEIYIDSDGNGVYEKYIHSFVGLTAANATPAQIAASINGDAQLANKVYAVAGLTANAVTLFPVQPGSKLYVGAQPAPLGFAGVADYTKRTYTSQTMVITGGVGWSWSYNAGTRVLTVKNETGGAVAGRIFIMVIR